MPERCLKPRWTHILKSSVVKFKSFVFAAPRANGSHNPDLNYVSSRSIGHYSSKYWTARQAPRAVDMEVLLLLTYLQVKPMENTAMVVVYLEVSLCAIYSDDPSLSLQFL